MADPTPQGTFPPLLGEVSDGDAVVFRRVGGSLYVASGRAGTGPTGPSGSGSAGATGPTGPSARVITFNPADKDTNITLSNNNLTATSASGGWVSVRAIGPFKSAGKAYFRSTTDVGHYMGGAFATASAPLNNFFGAAAGQGVLAYAQVSQPLTIFYHGANSGTGPTPTNSTDWIVTAIDLGTGNFWCTVQTVGGTLNTNWNNGANSPSAGTGAFATDLAGASVVPGCSVISPDPITIDANTVITDATLTGFVPWAQL